jgi:phosphoglycerate dehydrogenase-like enzyme
VILVHSGDAAEDAAVLRLLGERYPELTVLAAHTEHEIVERLPGAEILFAWRFPMALLAHGHRLRWFQVMGAGIERLTGAPLPAGVRVTNIRGVFGMAMAEYALAYMLAHAQDVRGILARQSRRSWEPFEPALLRDRTAGIVGLGSVGREIARRCAAFGMRVIGLKRGPGDVPEVERVYTVAEIAGFLPACDYLVTVVPHTAETTNLLNAERLRLLKPHCVYINIGRGNVVDLDALTEALRARRIAGAALDVFPEEPLPASHPLWELDNVFITPHVSGVNRPSDVTDAFLANLARYLAGEPLLNEVDLARGY